MFETVRQWLGWTFENEHAIHRGNLSTSHDNSIFVLLDLCDVASRE